MHRTDEATARARLLRGCYDAAIAAAQPVAAMREPLDSLPPPTVAAAVLAIGKASIRMSDALVRWLASHQLKPAAMMAVSHVAPAIAGVGPILVGDHPTPGPRSAAAADAIERWIASLPTAIPVHVAISGGSSSLIGAPVRGVDAADLHQTLDMLLRCGVPIDVMNAVRKRLLRLAGGRLGLLLDRHQVHCWIISDVPGDAVSTIGSGPLSGDPWSSAAVIQALRDENMWASLPSGVRAAITTETVKLDDPRLAHISTRIVATGTTAMTAGLAHARAAGFPTGVGGALSGDATQMGAAIAHQLAASPVGAVLAWCGETTVTLGATRGVGGRSQELSLSAARALAELPVAGSVLASSTDGQDGPTDVAGAIVDEQTAHDIEASGVSVDRALYDHNTTPALERAGALFRTGPSGTNVADLVFTIRG